MKTALQAVAHVGKAERIELLEDLVAGLPVKVTLNLARSKAPQAQPVISFSHDDT